MSPALDGRTLNARYRRVIRPIAHQARRSISRQTRGNRVFPSILVVGAQRSGTTSLHRALIQHPQIQGPAEGKGVHYFDLEFGRGDEWYLARFPASAPGVRLVETSPYYVFHPLVPARVADRLPDASIVILVRDPVERAYSQYFHEVNRGFETLGFEEALEAESSRLARSDDVFEEDQFAVVAEHIHHSYLARGRYAEQIVRWMACVAPGKMLVLDAGRLFRDPKSAIQTLADFLEIDPEYLEFPHANFYQRPELPASVKSYLSAYFEPFDAQLKPLVGWDPSWR